MVPRAHQSSQPNGSSVGAAVFAGLSSVTDRPTDHATRSVRIGRIYVRSTAMRPNNMNRLALQPSVRRQRSQSSETTTVTLVGVHLEREARHYKQSHVKSPNVM